MKPTRQKIKVKKYDIPVRDIRPGMMLLDRFGRFLIVSVQAESSVTRTITFIEDSTFHISELRKINMFDDAVFLHGALMFRCETGRNSTANYTAPTI